MKINLNDFLQSGVTTIKAGKDFFIKVPSGLSNCEYVYKCYNRGEFFNPITLNKNGTDFEGVCFEGHFYFASDYKTSSYELDGLNYSTIKGIDAYFTVDVMNLLELFCINLPYNESELTESEKVEFEQEAKRLHLKGERYTIIPKYQAAFSENIQLFLEVLLNYDDALMSTVEKYKADNMATLIYLAKKYQFINNILDSLNNAPASAAKQIYDILKDDTRKSVTIEYLKDGKELEFKIDTEAGRSILFGETISSFNIKEPAKRSKYKELFGHVDISVNHITKIKYGKKVLYAN